jgi:hypothetical protein
VSHERCQASIHRRRTFRQPTHSASRDLVLGNCVPLGGDGEAVAMQCNAWQLHRSGSIGRPISQIDDLTAPAQPTSLQQLTSVNKRSEPEMPTWDARGFKGAELVKAASDTAINSIYQIINSHTMLSTKLSADIPADLAADAQMDLRIRAASIAVAARLRHAVGQSFSGNLSPYVPTARRFF